jgi:hypothetical protein
VCTSLLANENWGMYTGGGEKERERQRHLLSSLSTVDSVTEELVLGAGHTSCDCVRKAKPKVEMHIPLAPAP